MKRIIKSIFAIILICIAYISLSISPIFFQDFAVDSNYNKIKTISHRGASNSAPENTLASVNEALKFDSDCIEIDVHQTIDSTIVLMHDYTLERTTNGTGLIKEKTFQDIYKLDAGSWFSDDFVGEKIPTLDKVLSTINGKCQVIIEIKKGHEFYPNIEKNILKILKKYNAEKWVSIHSFDYKILEAIHKLNPNITLQKLFVGNFKFTPFMVSTEIEKLDLDKYPYIKEYNLNYIFANRSIISFLKLNKKKVNVWTVNNADTAKELIALGADGIITNNPNLLKIN